MLEAEVDWNPEKKRWQVRVKLGEEVINGEEELRSLAVQTARDDGYDVDPAKVAIVR